MTGTRDPFRAFDGLEPAPDWEGVVARAEGLGPEVVDHRRRRRPAVIAIAAAVLVAAAIGGALASTGSSGNHQRVGSGDVAADPPTAMWGRLWQATRIVVDGKERPVVPGLVAPVRFDATTRGRALVDGCNRGGGEAVLHGDRLVVDGAWGTTAAGCVGDGGEALMEQDQWFGMFFRADPTVEVRGERLVLRTRHARVEWLDVRAVDPPGRIMERTWRLTRLVIDGREEPAVWRSPDEPIDVELYGGRITVGCPASSTDARVEGDRLVVSDRYVTLASPCTTAPSSVARPILERVAAVQAFFSSDPVIQLRGHDLVLSQGLDRIEATSIGSSPVASVPTTTTVPATTMTTTTTSPPPTTTAPSPTTSTPADGGSDGVPMDDIPEDPSLSAFFGHEWVITGAYTGTERHAFDEIRVHTESSGRVVVTGCHTIDWHFTLEGDRLVPDAGMGWSDDEKTCLASPDPDEDSWELDHFLMDLLQAGPRLSIDFTWHGSLLDERDGLLASFQLAT
jgi:heat shock protein HslJ